MWSCLLVWLSTVGGADSLEDYFPATPIDGATVTTILTPEILGAAATQYDARRASAAVDRNRTILATATGVEVAEVVVPEALQRFAELRLAVARHGKTDWVHSWFLAEHVGLPAAPRVVTTFVSGTEEGAAEMVEEVLREVGKKPAAVATADLEEADRSGFVGLVVVLDGVVDFEPFPRVVAPGASVRIPGTVLDAGSRYALYVQGEGTDVSEYPLEGDGAFDIEFQVPKTPGVYRVAMTRFEKRKMPDQPFFFSLYVGVDPPVAPRAQQETLHDPADLDGFEEELVRSVNRERAKFGLDPIARASDGSRMRSMLAELPDGERARVRHIRRELSRDPLPGEPHGTWDAAFGNGHLGADLMAWTWVQHPSLRDALLHPNQERMIVGVQHRDWGFQGAAVFVQSAAEQGTVRSEAWAALAARWGEGGPQPAPKLEAALTELAERLASGQLKTKKFGKELDKIFARRDLVEGQASANMWVVPPNHEVDVANMPVPPWGTHLAIGSATGTMGEKRGYTYAVLVAVISKKAH